VPDFTGTETQAVTTPPRSTGNPEFDRRIKELVQEWGCDRSCELIEEMMITALKMAREQVSMADLKLITRSLKELYYSARVFEPYTDIRKVVVFGSARIKPDEAAFIAAEEFSRKMRENNYMIITGGGDGIMGAAQQGAGREQSFGLNIRLPFEQRANLTIEGDPKLINFNYFFTRKVTFVKEASAVALFPGGFGTLDEGFETLTLMQTGKSTVLPLVLIDEPGGNYWETWFAFLNEYLLKLGLISETDFRLFKITDDVDEAVEEILQFYRNFHSYRWVGKQMVIRLLRPLTKDALAALNAEFKDLLQTGHISQGPALPQEKNEAKLLELPRLILIPHQSNFGRLRELIDAINRASTAGDAKLS
jgi:uncharacterized protein (TIGR00730 family)